MSKINIIFLSQTFYHGLLRDPKWSRSPLLHSHWQPLSHSRLLRRFSNTQISFPSQGFCLLGVASKFLISAAQISPTQKGLSQWQLTYKRPPHTHTSQLFSMAPSYSPDKTYHYFKFVLYVLIICSSPIGSQVSCLLLYPHSPKQCLWPCR